MKKLFCALTALILILTLPACAALSRATGTEAETQSETRLPAAITETETEPRTTETETAPHADDGGWDWLSEADYTMLEWKGAESSAYYYIRLDAGKIVFVKDMPGCHELCRAAFPETGLHDTASVTSTMRFSDFDGDGNGDFLFEDRGADGETVPVAYLWNAGTGRFELYVEKPETAFEKLGWEINCIPDGTEYPLQAGAMFCSEDGEKYAVVPVSWSVTAEPDAGIRKVFTAQARIEAVYLPSFLQEGGTCGAGVRTYLCDANTGTVLAVFASSGMVRGTEFSYEWNGEQVTVRCSCGAQWTENPDGSRTFTERFELDVPADYDGIAFCSCPLPATYEQMQMTLLPQPEEPVPADTVADNFAEALIWSVR